MRLGKDKVREFLDDIKAGMSDIALQEKYALSGNEFRVAKASALDFIRAIRDKSAKPARRISARSFLNDVTSGVDDQTLMSKYDLTQRELQSLFRQLIDAGLVTPLELANRLEITKSQVAEAFAEMGKAIDELD
ncbi:MAG: hypothetical protein RDU20_15915 [Desulfomonilaceae bacterium]|nr:hypothetical protein [Desulfomonilaceae bacterium]